MRRKDKEATGYVGMPIKADSQAYNVLLTTRQCTALLKPLLKMDAAHPFLKPVDPVALQLPDYLNIIKKPMDLETIQTKLETGKCAFLRSISNAVPQSNFLK